MSGARQSSCRHRYAQRFKRNHGSWTQEVLELLLRRINQRSDSLLLITALHINEPLLFNTNHFYFFGSHCNA